MSNYTRPGVYISYLPSEAIGMGISRNIYVFIAQVVNAAGTTEIIKSYVLILPPILFLKRPLM